MEKNYWKPIRDFLDQIEALQPIDTGVEKQIGRNNNVKACVFDVYGTLLISASGDIDQAEFSDKALRFAFEQADMKLDVPEEKRPEILEKMLQGFKETVKRTHREKQNEGIPFPEVDFVKMWEQVLEKYAVEGIIQSYSESKLKLFTFSFELVSNKLYPMPYMHKVLYELKQQGLPLGIVSNAQFFTPMLMNYFLNDELIETTQIPGFENELVLYSYLIGRSKPDVNLFNELKYILWNKYGIKAEETLYIGNDMYNDIYPSNKAGFQTVLFAGDKRSLRWRKNIDEVQHIQPDHIITDLRDVLSIVES